jgi:hypothetical protein
MIFTEKDYESGDGMLTSVWGPSMWHFLHTMSFNYPIKPCCSEKQNYYNFIINLRNILPCGKCRENLCKNFKKLPLKKIHMASRATFSRYVYDLHELINNMLNKKSGLSYEDVRERYEHFRARCTKSKKEIRSRMLHMMKKKEKTALKSSSHKITANAKIPTNNHLVCSFYYCILGNDVQSILLNYYYCNTHM